MNTSRINQDAPLTTSRVKWKALIALALILIGTIMGWSWVWGVLFLYWAITDLYYRETHLIERVARADNPITYWLIVITWIVLSVLYFVPDSVWYQIGWY